MDNEQALLTLLPLLAAVIQLNSAFYDATITYMLRKQAIIRVIISSGQSLCSFLQQHF